VKRYQWSDWIEWLLLLGSIAAICVWIAIINQREGY